MKGVLGIGLRKKLMKVVSKPGRVQHGHLVPGPCPRDQEDAGVLRGFWWRHVEFPKNSAREWSVEWGCSQPDLEPLTNPVWPRCVESGRDARKSDEATRVVEER